MSATNLSEDIWLSGGEERCEPQINNVQMPTIISLPIIEATPVRCKTELSRNSAYVLFQSSVSGAVKILQTISNLSASDDQNLILSADMGMLVRCKQAQRRRKCDTQEDFNQFSFLFGGLHLHFMAASVAHAAGQDFGLSSLAKKLKIDRKVTGQAKDAFEAHEAFYEGVTVALLRKAFITCSSEMKRPVTCKDVFSFLVRLHTSFFAKSLASR